MHFIALQGPRLRRIIIVILYNLYTIIYIYYKIRCTKYTRGRFTRARLNEPYIIIQHGLVVRKSNVKRYKREQNRRRVFINGRLIIGPDRSKASPTSEIPQLNLTQCLLYGTSSKWN